LSLSYLSDFCLRLKGHQTRIDILVTCQPNQFNQINQLFTLLMEIKLDQSAIVISWQMSSIIYLLLTM